VIEGKSVEEDDRHSASHRADGDPPAIVQCCQPRFREELALDERIEKAAKTSGKTYTEALLELPVTEQLQLLQKMRGGA
jgi:hypothetical protein